MNQNPKNKPKLDPELAELLGAMIYELNELYQEFLKVGTPMVNAEPKPQEHGHDGATATDDNTPS